MMDRSPSPDAPDADQDALVAWLAASGADGDLPGRVIRTHASVVVLRGQRAFKLKRAVRYPYLDYGTVERRGWACRREVELNRRTAPQLYIACHPVLRDSSGGFRFGADASAADAADAVDWVVEMRRFPDDALLDRLAAQGDLPFALMRAAARSVAALHRMAERLGLDGAPGPGDLETNRWVGRDNAEGLRHAESRRPGLFDRASVDRLQAATAEWIERHGALIETRRRQGFVRRCHGDLHLRNICVLDGQPVLFDGIEFDDRLSVIDVWYDTAFLLMDLLRCGQRTAAQLVFSTYVDATDDRTGLPLLPLFLSLRAGIRAKVTGMLAATTAPADQGADDIAAEARADLALGLALLAPAPPRLVAVGGLSGTGKSTLAAALAPWLDPVPGALVLRADVVRKRMAGIGDTDRLPDSAYTPDATRAVYASLVSNAEALLRAGVSTIVDAVHARPEERAAIAALARRLGVRFDGLWLDAPPDRLVERVTARTEDASDADAAVVRLQLGYALGPIDWARLDAGGTIEALQRAARGVLALDR